MDTFIHSFLVQALVLARLRFSDRTMDGGTLIGRLDRIEAALDRIEASAARIEAERHDEQSAAVSGDTQLEERHSALQTSVRAALARLDALIEGSAG